MEPFAGMLGVLLQRPKAERELVSDLDGRIVNWWRVIRDRRHELMELLALTPRSESEFHAQRENLNHEDPVRRALATHYVILHSLYCALNSNSFRCAWMPRRHYQIRWPDRQFEALYERIRDVELMERDAVHALSRTAPYADWTVYCDPPYRDADTDVYGRDGSCIDREALREALLAQRGAVAISGFGDEWDCLGWMRHERDVDTTTFTSFEKATQPRTEVLWTNYEPADGPLYG